MTFELQGAKDKEVIEGGQSTRVYNAKVGKAQINVKVSKCSYVGIFDFNSLWLSDAIWW